MAWTNRLARKREEPAQTALFLQGGGALGAYQGGAYAAMSEEGIHPDWVAGVSIGGINGAIIAGNPPGSRSQKLRAFWDHVDNGHADAASTLINGVPHFFKPNAFTATDHYELLHIPPIFRLPDPVVKTAMYDPSPLRETLRRFVDFDYLNNESPTRLSVGAADVESSRLVYFDTMRHMSTAQTRAVGKPGIMQMEQEIVKTEITPEHIMASGALAPGFPAVKIGDRHYVDGGILPNSNTPAFWAHKTGQLHKGMTVLRVNLWDAKGKVPDNVAEAAARIKAMQFAGPHLDLGGEVKADIATTLQFRPGQSFNLDYDFSHHALRQNWDAGYADMKRAIAQQREAAAARGNGHARRNGHALETQPQR